MDEQHGDQRSAYELHACEECLREYGMSSVVLCQCTACLAIEACKWYSTTSFQYSMWNNAIGSCNQPSHPPSHQIPQYQRVTRGTQDPAPFRAREEQPIVYREDEHARKFQGPHVEYTPQCWYNQQQSLASMTQTGRQCFPSHVANERISSNKTCGCAFCYPAYGSESGPFSDFKMDIQYILRHFHTPNNTQTSSASMPQEGSIYPSIPPFQQNFATNFDLGRAPFPVSFSSDAGPRQTICITSPFIASYYQYPPNIPPHLSYAENDPINHTNSYLDSPAPLISAQDEDEKELPMWCWRRLASDGELYPPGVGGPSVGMKTHNEGNITIAPNEIMAQAHVAQPSSVLAYASPTHSEINYDHGVNSNAHGAPTPFSGFNFNASFGTHNSGIDYDPVAVHHDEILVEVRPDTGVRPTSAFSLPAPFFPEDAGSWGDPYMNT